MRHGSRTRHGKPGTKREYLPTPLKKLNIIAKRNRYNVASSEGTRVIANGEIVEVEGGVVVGSEPFNFPPLFEDRGTKLRHWNGMSAEKLGTVPKVNHSRAEENLLREIRPWKVVASEIYQNYPLLLRERRPYVNIRLFTDEQLIELHAQGLNGREIGEKLGAVRNTVSRHRMRLGLKPHRLFTDQQLINLHKRGLSGREIAEKLGVNRRTVTRHRRRLGLKAIRKHKP